MEPKFILSKNKVHEQYKKLKNLDPTVEISYSWKTNPDVGKILEEETDSFFSLHSTEEISNINDKSRIWFFVQAWNEKKIKILIEKGIIKFVIDNEKDFEILFSFISSLDFKKYIKKRKIDVALRMKFQERRIGTGRYFVYGMGCKKIINLILKLKKINEKNNFIGRIGIHIHRKTQNTSEWDIKEELEDSFPKKLFEIIDFVNIGGGFPIQYKNYRDVLDYVFEKIKELKNWLEKKQIRLILEPGRFIAGPSVKLETEVILVYDNNVILNCSVYQGITDSIFRDSLKLIVEGEIEEEEDGNDQNNYEEIGSYVLKGKTPCNLDIIRYNVKILKPRVGQKITFLNAGAYNFSTDFCNLEKVKTEIVD